jgi:hypothetical protein
MTRAMSLALLFVVTSVAAAGAILALAYAVAHR